MDIPITPRMTRLSSAPAPPRAAASSPRGRSVTSPQIAVATPKKNPRAGMRESAASSISGQDDLGLEAGSGRGAVMPESAGGDQWIGAAKMNAGNAAADEC